MDNNKLILKPGLEGVPVTNSSICDIDGNKGKLLYRGYSIEELSKKSSFLETAYLLIWGELPNEKELSNVSNEIQESSSMDKDLEYILKSFPEMSDANSR